MKKLPYIFILGIFFLASCGGSKETTSENEGETTSEEEMSERDYGSKAEETQTEDVEELSNQTIVEIAKANEDLSTLVTALAAADLVETLNGEGPFTVFAPTNAAFEALPDGTLKQLMEPENKAQLADVLTYHVIPGRVTTADISDAMRVTTVNGKELTFTVPEAGYEVNDINIIQGDIPAANGVIHVVQGVIIPPEGS